MLKLVCCWALEPRARAKRRAGAHDRADSDAGDHALQMDAFRRGMVNCPLRPLERPPILEIDL
jgi:hypothetical protein